MLYVVGCGDKVQTATVEQYRAFESASRKPLEVDMDAIRRARPPAEFYRVVSGDVLEFTMPLLLRAVSLASPDGLQAPSSVAEPPFICRVNQQGAIALPGVGELVVAGDSLSEIEEKVVGLYRDYVALRPTVFVRVLEYRIFPVTILGAVAKPGVYALRHDQMSLAVLLMEAGGVVEAGAALIRIGRAGNTDRQGAARAGGVLAEDRELRLAGQAAQLGSQRGKSFDVPASFSGRPGSKLDRFVHPSARTASRSTGIETAWTQTGSSGRTLSEIASEGGEATDDRESAALVLPMVGSNIPFRDVPLRSGDTVVVEHVEEALFSVLGLVNRPGNFPYPRNARYNLGQAIAFAEGLDPVADPRYITVYRLAEDESIVRIPFRLVEDDEFTEVLRTVIQPGDVVAVENTPRTRTNTMIHNMLRINMGMYLTGRDVWDRD